MLLSCSRINLITTRCNISPFLRAIIFCFRLFMNFSGFWHGLCIDKATTVCRTGAGASGYDGILEGGSDIYVLRDGVGNCR